MFEKDEGTEQRMKIDILKMVYYMLRDLGEDSGAEAIARAIFEMTADEDGEGAGEGAGGAWYIYAPPRKGEQKDPWAAGLAMIDEGRNEEAVEYFRQKLWEQGSLHFNIGLPLYRLGRNEEALVHFEKAVEIEPEDPEYLNLLGQTFEELGQTEEAELTLLKSLKADPDYALSYYDLGVVLAKRRTRDAEAKACFDKAIALDPGMGWAYYCIACLKAIEGKKQDALKHLRTAFEKGVRDRRHIAKDTDLDSLRGDPAFQKLLRRYFSDTDGESRTGIGT